MSDKLTPDQARAILDQERTNRALSCRQEITTVLEKYACNLIAIPSITPDGRISAQAQIVPRD